MSKIFKLFSFFLIVFFTSTALVLGQTETYRHLNLRAGSKTVFKTPGLTRPKYLPVLIEVDEFFPEILNNKEIGEVRAFYDKKYVVFLSKNGDEIARKEGIEKQKRKSILKISFIKNKNKNKNNKKNKKNKNRVKKIKLKINKNAELKTYFLGFVAGKKDKNIPVADLEFQKDPKTRSFVAGLTFTIRAKGKNLKNANISLIYPPIFNIEKEFIPLMNNIQKFIQFIPLLSTLTKNQKKEMLGMYQEVLNQIEELKLNEKFKDRITDLDLLSQDFQRLADMYIPGIGNLRMNGGGHYLAKIAFRFLRVAEAVAAANVYNENNGNNDLELLRNSIFSDGENAKNGDKKNAENQPEVSCEGEHPELRDYDWNAGNVAREGNDGVQCDLNPCADSFDQGKAEALKKLNCCLLKCVNNSNPIFCRNECGHVFNVRVDELKREARQCSIPKIKDCKNDQQRKDVGQDENENNPSDCNDTIAKCDEQFKSGTQYCIGDADICIASCGQTKDYHQCSASCKNSESQCIDSVNAQKEECINKFDKCVNSGDGVNNELEQEEIEIGGWKDKQQDEQQQDPILNNPNNNNLSDKECQSFTSNNNESDNINPYIHKCDLEYCNKNFSNESQALKQQLSCCESRCAGNPQCIVSCRETFNEKQEQIGNNRQTCQEMFSTRCLESGEEEENSEQIHPDWCQEFLFDIQKLEQKMGDIQRETDKFNNLINNGDIVGIASCFDSCKGNEDYLLCIDSCIVEAQAAIDANSDGSETIQIGASLRNFELLFSGLQQLRDLVFGYHNSPVEKGWYQDNALTTATNRYNACNGLAPDLETLEDALPEDKRNEKGQNDLTVYEYLANNTSVEEVPVEEEPVAEEPVAEEPVEEEPVEEEPVEEEPVVEEPVEEAPVEEGPVEEETEEEEGEGEGEGEEEEDSTNCQWNRSRINHFNARRHFLHIDIRNIENQFKTQSAPLRYIIEEALSSYNEKKCKAKEVSLDVVMQMQCAECVLPYVCDSDASLCWGNQDRRACRALYREMKIHEHDLTESESMMESGRESLKTELAEVQDLINKEVKDYYGSGCAECNPDGSYDNICYVELRGECERYLTGYNREYQNCTYVVND